MKNHLLFIASIVVNLSFLRVTLLFSEATMERGLSNVSIARKPFSGVASEMDIKVTLTKERFTTIFAMKSR